MTVKNQSGYSDQELFRLMVSRSHQEREKGWTLAYKMFYPMVRDLVWKSKGNEEDILDVYQEAMSILYNSMTGGTFRLESSLRTYLYSISRNLWLKEVKNREKRALSVPEMIHDLKTDLNVYRIDIEVVRLLLWEMKTDCRQVLIEYYFNGRSLEELRQIFNLGTVQAAKNKKGRCLMYLKRLFEERSIIPFNKIEK